MRGHGWQIHLRLMTLSTAGKGKQRDLRRWQRADSRLSEAHTEGYIHNTLVRLRLQTQSLIIGEKTPCIMNINLLCSVHVMMTQIPPHLASWTCSYHGGYLYSHQTSAMQISKYWHHHVDTCGGGGGRGGGSQGWELGEVISEVWKRNWNATRRRVLRVEKATFSTRKLAILPSQRQKDPSKGTRELGVLSSMKCCIAGFIKVLLSMDTYRIYLS